MGNVFSLLKIFKNFSKFSNFQKKTQKRNWDTSAPSEDAPRNNKQILTGQPKFVSSYRDVHGQERDFIRKVPTK